MNYMVYTGFVNNIVIDKYANKNAQDFFDIWYKNTRKYINENISIIILGPDSPNIDNTENIKILETYDNLGHVGEYINNSRVGRWCGWTAAIVFGMIHAYVKNVDFVYKEQDCLAFGDYIERMYKDCEGHDIVYGSYTIMDVAQSLFLVKRDAIPDVIASLAKDDDKNVLPEHKFLKLPVKQKRLSFGYDRDRPFNENDSCFYIQQLSTHDLEKLINKGLIEI